MLLKDCIRAETPPAFPGVDPYLAAPIIHGCDYETFEAQMTDWHQAWTKLHQNEHGAEYELRPVRRADEPRLTVTAGWGNFFDDPVAQSRLTAQECFDQLAAMKLRS
jgi:hypothetical protein